MIVLKCKMCGADLDPQENSTVCECDYCGTKQTIPAVDDEKKLKLYDRANRLRMNAEFDKAAGVYESIVADFDSEAEAYWGMLLCKYGIEYVDDPATGNKIPTCHRSSYESIMDDADFELVMENAVDTLSRTVYREQAKQIEEIRKGIIEVSGKEEPYDIFICYKETAEDGGRTIDSVLAQDVYDALTTKGYRVFFSRITLEDKLGTEYEPYIFAALTSAKVMLAFGTSYDYYNAVWVKNEWSRFLKLMAKDKEKHLIPCYKDIDAYDMPKEFAKLQAQDLGKIGAVQDLVRGIDKLIGKNISSSTFQRANNDAVAPLITRMYMFLEDCDWKSADEYAERILDMDPENGEAYLGKFMAEQKVRAIAEIGNRALGSVSVNPFDGNANYRKLMKYASADVKNVIVRYAEITSEKSRQKMEELRREREEQRKQEEERKRQEEEAVNAKKREKKQKFDELENEIQKNEEKLESLTLESFTLDAEQKAEYEKRKASAVEAESEYKGSSLSIDISNTEMNIDILKAAISEKQQKLSQLGIFKGKEKKQLQNEISDAYAKIAELEECAKRDRVKLDSLNRRSRDAKTYAETYYQNALKENYDKEKAAINETITSLQDEISNMLGNSFELGRLSDGKPVEWIRLTTENGKSLLISKFILEDKQYHSEDIDVTWNECELRSYLNQEFLNKVFNKDEQERILTSAVHNDKYQYHILIPGDDTYDKLFLLSVEEAGKYFTGDKERIATKIWEASGSWWWLRSPGSFSGDAALVFVGGSVDTDGLSVNLTNGIRPAFWIKNSDLGSLIF